MAQSRLFLIWVLAAFPILTSGYGFDDHYLSIRDGISNQNEVSIELERELDTGTGCEHEGDLCDDGDFCNGPDRCNSELKCVPTNHDIPCAKCSQICDLEYSICIEENVDCRQPSVLFIEAIWNPDTCECEYKAKEFIPPRWKRFVENFFELLSGGA